MTTQTGIPTTMPNQNNVLLPPQSYETTKLLKYCYVASQKRFVLIEKPLENPLTVDAFDEVFFDVPIPKVRRNGRLVDIKPSQYIREFHRKERVVAYIDLLPQFPDLIVHDPTSEQKILNTYRPPLSSPEKVTVTAENYSISIWNY